MSKKHYLQKNNSSIVRQETRFSGPIPPPQDLKHYDDIVPGAAKIIIEMADRQAKHRQELEKKVINSDVKNSSKGLIFGLIIGVVGMLSGVYVIYLGHVLSGTFIGGGTIASLVSTFVYGSRGRRKEREKKNI